MDCVIILIINKKNTIDQKCVIFEILKFIKVVDNSNRAVNKVFFIRKVFSWWNQSTWQKVAKIHMSKLKNYIYDRVFDFMWYGSICMNKHNLLCCSLKFIPAK